MAGVTIQLGPQETRATVVSVAVPYVQVKTKWDDKWKTVDYLVCMDASDAASTFMGEAHFRYRYGTIKREDLTTFSSYDPEQLLEKYVRVVTPTDNGSQVQWVGWMANFGFSPQGAESNPEDGKPSGDQFYTAYTLDFLLRRSTIDKAFCKQGSKEIEIDLVPAFNENSGWSLKQSFSWGNRSATVGSKGVDLFEDNRQPWTNKQAVEYLLKYFAPGGVTYPDGPTFKLGGVIGELDKLKMVTFTEGLMLWSALNELIRTDRGLGWKIETDGEGDVTLFVFMLDGSPGATGDEDVEPESDTALIDISDDIWITSAFISNKTSLQFDKIIVYGQRILTSFTLSIADGNLEKGWETEDETAYAAENDDKRQSPEHDRVYTYFRAPDDWDFKAGDGFGGEQHPVSPTVKKDGKLDTEVAADEWNANRNFEPIISLLKPFRKADSEPEYLEVMVFIKNPRFEGLEIEEQYIMASEWEHPVTVRMADRDLALTVEGQYRHLFGKGTFDNEASPSSKFLPEFDYNTMVATVSMRTHHRIKVEVDITDNSEADFARVKMIPVHDAQLWYVVKGTRYFTNSKWLEKHEGGIERDDSPQLRQIAAFAKIWYGKKRSSVTFNEKGINYKGMVGKYIKRIKTSSQSEDVNTPITSIKWDFENFTTTVTTGYVELDIISKAGDVNIPGLSDADTVGKKVLDLEAKIKELMIKVGSLPHRRAVAPSEIKTDDKYKPDSDVQTCKELIRESDGHHGHQNDHHGVDPVLSQFEGDPGGQFRIGWHINDSWTLRDFQGGLMWHWAEPTLTGYSRADTSVPNKRLGFVGDVMIIALDAHQELGTNSDGNKFYIVSVRHDFQRYKDDDHHGKDLINIIPIGIDPPGLLIWGEKLFDHTKANNDTALGHETGQWRPSIKIPAQPGEDWFETEGWTDAGWPPGEGPVGGGVVPPQETKGKMQVLAWSETEGQVASAENSVAPKALIDSAVVPLVITGMFVTPIPGGEILAAANAVFRFNIYIFRGDTASSPSLVRHGLFNVPIAASPDDNIVTVTPTSFSSNELQAGDMMVIILWRDFGDPNDTADYPVYTKSVKGLIGETVTEGHYFNDYSEDQTRTAGSTVIAYPYIA